MTFTDYHHHSGAAEAWIAFVWFLLAFVVIMGTIACLARSLGRRHRSRQGADAQAPAPPESEFMSPARVDAGSQFISEPALIYEGIPVYCHTGGDELAVHANRPSAPNSTPPLTHPRTRPLHSPPLATAARPAMPPAPHEGDDNIILRSMRRGLRRSRQVVLPSTDVADDSEVDVESGSKAFLAAAVACPSSPDTTAHLEAWATEQAVDRVESKTLGRVDHGGDGYCAYLGSRMEPRRRRRRREGPGSRRGKVAGDAVEDPLARDDPFAPTWKPNTDK